MVESTAWILDSGCLTSTSRTLPELPAGNAIIRVTACGLCGTDLHLLQGMHLPPGASYPLQPGHEVAGIVEEVADDVDAALIGRDVVLHPLAPCGQCSRCCEGLEQRCPDSRILGIHEPGGLADRLIWPADRLALTSGIAPASAAILADAGATAYHAVQTAQISEGARVCVLGAGGVGTQVIAIARALVPGISLSAVVGSATSAERLRGVADHVEVGVVDIAKRLLSIGDRFDVVIDFSAQPQAPEQGLRLLVPGGRLVLGGVSEGRLDLGPAILLQSRELSVHGVYTSSLQDLRDVIALVESGQFDTGSSITHTFPLDCAPDALAALESRPPGMVRVVVTANEDTERPTHPTTS